MNTLYSHAIRVLACQSCGAPIDATIAGGQVRCSYCNATNLIQQRDEAADRARAEEALAAPISESERYAQLRLQDQGPERLPESLTPLLAGEVLSNNHVPQAQADWQQARQQLAAGSQAFSLAERFFWLTILLTDHLDDRRQRASLETAAELLTDARHRHVIRCMLARLAAQHGDLSGAEAWLQTCNPRPTDLMMDTAYRYAAATLATARQTFPQVFDLLGHRSGDVPLWDRQQLACELLRLNAVEGSGRFEEATNALSHLILTEGEHTIRVLLEKHTPMRLCQGAFAQAQRQQMNASHEQTLRGLVAERQKIHTGVGAFAGSLARLPVWALILMIPIMVVRCAADADPLMGIYGVALCPKVCAGCEGPTRTVTVWQQVGPGEWSSDGAEYFCSGPNADVRHMSDAQLESNIRRLSEYELSWGAVWGATFLIVVAFLAPFVPFMGLLRMRLRSNQAHELDARIAHASHALGRAPPPISSRSSWRNVLSALGIVGIAILAAFALLALGMLF